MTARTVLYAFATDGATLKEFQARFASVVYPGATLVVEMWDVSKPNFGDAKALERTRQIRFQTKIKESGKIALSNGRAVILLKQDTSKL
jgi:peroxisomal enoyl-CoA hydratase 2